MGGVTYKYETLKENNEVEPGKNAIVKIKPWYKSKTILFNGLLFAGVSFVQVYDILTGSNALEPIISVFTDNPDTVTKILTVLTQVYTAINFGLRYVTKSPITFSRAK